MVLEQYLRQIRKVDLLVLDRHGRRLSRLMLL